jgi:hypothetical protein
MGSFLVRIPLRVVSTISLLKGEAHLGIWATSLEQYPQSMDDFFRLYLGKPPHPDENKDD